MNAFAQGNGHREGILDTFLGTNAYTVSHRHSWAEVGVAQALGSQALHQGTYNAVTAWIPSCCNDTDGICLLVQLHQSFTVATDISMDVERVNGIDAQGQDLLGKLLARAGRSGQNGNVDVLQFLDVLNDLVRCQFGGLVSITVASYYTCNLEVGSGLECLNTVLSNVAVTYDGCANLFHCLLPFICYVCVVPMSIIGCKVSVI